MKSPPNRSKITFLPDRLGATLDPMHQAHGGGSMKRLMIVTDNSLAAQSIRLALRQTSGFKVIGYFDGRASIETYAANEGADIILVDDMQEPEHSLARLEELTALCPNAKRVFLTMRMDDESLTEVFAAGANAVISKAVHPVSLATLVREISRDTVVHMLPRTPAKTLRSDCPLTDRELEILRLVAHGYTNGRIARELWVTEQTVKFHLSNTYRKLGVANRTEASRYAHMNDLLAAA
jgi:DNA-binding NarL/FixJ family response regulator